MASISRLILTAELKRQINDYRYFVRYGVQPRYRRQIIHAPLGYRTRCWGSMENRKLLALRTIFYPASVHVGSLGRYFKTHQRVARAKLSCGFLATCRRLNLLPPYISARRPYPRSCVVTRLAKRAGEIFVREKVRSAHRKLIAKKLAPILEKLAAEDELRGDVKEPFDLSSFLTAQEEVDLDLWSGRAGTPIFPLPIIRNTPTKGKKRKLARKPFYGYLGPTPTIPVYIAQLHAEERLLTILESVRLESRAREKQREELLRRVKQLQNRVHLREEEGEESSNSNTNPDDQNRCLRSLPQFARRADSAAVREMWRKRFLETKKSTPRMEEECSKLRQELEKLHRELLARVQAGVWALLTISGKTEKPSNKLSYKIMIARLLQEVEDLSRRVEGTRLRLHTEVKLRAMAEKDVRNLREELLKKKIQVTLTRNQEQAALGNGIRQQYFISAV